MAATDPTGALQLWPPITPTAELYQKALTREAPYKSGHGHSERMVASTVDTVAPGPTEPGPGFAPRPVLTADPARVAELVE
jgi:hypothetical protein